MKLGTDLDLDHTICRCAFGTKGS